MLETPPQPEPTVPPAISSHATSPDRHAMNPIPTAMFPVPSPLPSSILALAFRAGSAFDLVLFDRLPIEEQALLQELRADPALYGVLKPHPESGLTLKAVDRDTALLLLTLREPGHLPFYVLTSADEGTEAGLEQLVLDRVLEVEIGGSFVAGHDALEALQALRAEPGADLTAAAQAPSGYLAQVSLAALRHAEASDLDDPRELASLLYGFNRDPLSPAWDALLPDAAAVLAFLGAGTGTALAQRLETHWEHGERPSSPGWIVFGPRQDTGLRDDGATFKLYVSPKAEALPRAFAQVVEVLSRQTSGNGISFKVGSNAAGVLRPDKLVLYFRGLEPLVAVARELETRLAGLPAQGVPFSAPIDPAGLLSWGADPPSSARLVSWQGPESWRQWVARRLAAALLAARTSGAASRPTAPLSPDAPDAPAAPPAWSFALERLRREGVDVERWTPSAALWAAA